MFQVANIQPGLYDLKIQIAGFKTRTSTDLQLDQNQNMNLGKKYRKKIQCQAL